MLVARARICNRKGLHARAAAKLVKTAAAFDAQVKIIAISYTADPQTAPSAAATSILSLLMLAAEMGSDVEIQAEGAQAQEALHAIEALIARRFDEEE